MGTALANIVGITLQSAFFKVVIIPDIESLSLILWKMSSPYIRLKSFSPVIIGLNEFDS